VDYNGRSDAESPAGAKKKSRRSPYDSGDPRVLK
jgi:hypothetical protein